MNFKQPKQRVLDEAMIRAQDRIRSALMSAFGNDKFDQAPVLNSIAMATSHGIREALEVVIENIYTDIDFEEDMQLKEKI